MNKKQKGFTLVEMILVTVIIGIVAGIVINIINIPRVQAKSRDSKRVGDLKMIQSALELYFADNRQYPPQNGSWLLLSTTHPSLNNYISNIPLDPRKATSSGTTCFTAGVTNYGYYYRSQTSGKYILGGVMEIMDTSLEKRSCNVSDTSNCGDSAPNNYACQTANKRCYCVQNPM